MKTIEYKNIPNSLRKFRKANGYSQKRVAVLLGIRNPGMISRWETGSRLPSPVNMFRLAIVYHTMVDALYSDLILILRRQMQVEWEEREEETERHERKR